MPSRKPSTEDVFWREETQRQKRKQEGPEANEELNRRLSAGFAAINGEGVYADDTDEDDEE